jgi:hypothetical protein
VHDRRRIDERERSSKGFISAKANFASAFPAGGARRNVCEIKKSYGYGVYDWECQAPPMPWGRPHLIRASFLCLPASRLRIGSGTNAEEETRN